MNQKYMLPLAGVFLLFLLAYAGVEGAGLQWFFGIVIPYLAVIAFIWGFVNRVMGWAASAVPFRIPTTCGQQKSLPWIKQNCIDNPDKASGVFIRMLLEIFLFRSLFRNTKAAFNRNEKNKLTYSWEIFLWVGALAFHYAFLVVIVRHLRFFLEPVPACLTFLEFMDGIVQIGLPGIFISGIVLLFAALFLLARRIFDAKVSYISLAADYFPLFLIIGIAVTGIAMRYFTKVDIVGIKEFTMGLVTFHPVIPAGVGGLFYAHVFMVSLLFAYFPMSKLMHMGGIFLSPTRNMANNTRAKRHVNPWNYAVDVHTYEHYEDHFREKMIEAGLPVDKKE
ncbi:Hdr-like menaquinol oxidoreductase cytochrome b-like subunit [Desulfamplus magnetovallimortis]|uniref:Hdr-like menaquinol oxidoreductase cytochrome b-like subunit n=1 Tax=Desulfamplus magnetovallimortis TaxID=1246637 RepID=A0A1W1HCK5_9BACT|nr:sulfate reduction electron transfer complex DsrMKJOP subunit DsrM [Desulfamplus magnetovallimortis]SLM30166.1 Hdr-like menaquinol oxidoreductase cytochrome b-like subunit [Desulfamplus magnetovallimortis]